MARYIRPTSTFALFGLLGVIAALWLSGTFATGDAKKVVPSDPDAGKSDDVRLANQATARSEWEARYEKWKGTLDLSVIDLRALPHAEMMVESGTPEPTFEAAIDAADRVVVGTVVSLKSTVWSGTLVTIHVERTLKGKVSGH